MFGLYSFVASKTSNVSICLDLVGCVSFDLSVWCAVFVDVGVPEDVAVCAVACSAMCVVVRSQTVLTFHSFCICSLCSQR